MDNKKVIKLLLIGLGGVLVLVLIVVVILLTVKVINLEKENENSQAQEQANDRNSNNEEESDEDDNQIEESRTIVINSINEEVIVGSNDCVYTHTYPQLSSNVEFEYLDEVNEDLEKYDPNEADSLYCDTDMERMNPTAPYYTQELTFDATNITEDVFCFVFDKSFYVNGAAHPGFEVSIDCYDLENEEKLDAFSDILDGDYREALVNYYETELPIELEYPQFWSDGSITADEAFDRANFYIRDGNLVLLWQPYDIAPGVFGVIEIEIPNNEIDVFYSDDSVLDRF